MFLSSKRSDELWGTPSLLFNTHWSSFPGLKPSRRDVYHSPLSSSEVKNGWSYTFTSLYVSMASTKTSLNVLNPLTGTSASADSAFSMEEHNYREYVSRTTRDHCHNHNSPLQESTLSQLNPVHTPEHSVFKNNFNTVIYACVSQMVLFLQPFSAFLQVDDVPPIWPASFSDSSVTRCGVQNCNASQSITVFCLCEDMV